MLNELETNKSDVIGRTEDRSSGKYYRKITFNGKDYYAVPISPEESIGEKNIRTVDGQVFSLIPGNE